MASQAFYNLWIILFMMERFVSSGHSLAQPFLGFVHPFNLSQGHFPVTPFFFNIWLSWPFSPSVQQSFVALKRAHAQLHSCETVTPPLLKSSWIHPLSPSVWPLVVEALIQGGSNLHPSTSLPSTSSQYRSGEVVGVIIWFFFWILYVNKNKFSVLSICRGKDPIFSNKKWQYGCQGDD